MIGSLVHLCAAAFLFVASHLVLAAPKLRQPVAGAIGEWGFKGAYSLVSVALFAWMIMAYRAAPEVELFEPGTAMRHASLTLMMIAAFLVIGGYTTPNPGIMGMEAVGLRAGPRGVLKITRHPVMWGVALWGVSHLLGTGDAGAMVFFGALTVLALAGAWHIDAKRRASHGEAWKAFEAETSFWPLGAILAGRTKIERGETKWWQTLLAVLAYVGMLWAHAEMGLDVFPPGFF
ncbi:MAG: NnrU family protein [Magnetovibrio sp.]|nr:NnrU family protein [Magnetovibrio sp.]